jgi:hypothetical protein
MLFKSYMKGISSILTQKIEQATNLFYIGLTLKNQGETEQELDDGAFLVEESEKDIAKLTAIAQAPKCIFNATPHPVTIMTEDGKVISTIEPCGILPRLVPIDTTTAQSMDTMIVAPIDVKGLDLEILNLPITIKDSNMKINGLPEFEAGVFYIVPFVIFQACPTRTDLLQIDAVRDEKGFTIGAKGFIKHKG